ncbi:response regulator transcription factor [Ruminococcus sp. OA3]|uniref:response regulator n=1 Tax=Ruminococcus sp. OA3 TaxID=2914164 RepID=UPI001F051172|nr:response regulator transcription factor [Ruminococcus sp. OA3]MCH1982701.1 response regulator transcription factor [Ruminococcus sp. OA3]
MNIVIIDDDCLVSGALKNILETDPEIRVTATGTDGAEALPLYEEFRPDVLLMDIRMQNTDGLDGAVQILSKHPGAKILLLTTFSDDEYIVKALRAGVKGYLLKQDYQSIIPAIKSVHTGQTVFGDTITAKIPDLLQTSSDFDYEAHNINSREFEVIKLVADGKSNKEIAEYLFLSEGTVRNYLSLILEKLSLRDRTQLAIFYYQHL